MNNFTTNPQYETEQTILQTNTHSSNTLLKTSSLDQQVDNQQPLKIQHQPQPKIITFPNEKNQLYPESNLNCEYNYIFFEGDQIVNEKKNITYEVISLIGKGTFGQVFECKSSLGVRAAIKVVKNQPAYRNQGLLQVKMLREIAKAEKAMEGSRENYLNVYDGFIWKGHVCVVMQILDNSLLDILNQNQFKGITLKWIQIWTKNILLSLVKIHKLHIIHSDIKPENVMFRPEKPRHPLLIDFSSGCYTYRQYFSYIQSRYYRAPQVLIGLKPYTQKIDIWSLGCVLAELYLGLPIFPGSCVYDQLKKILQLDIKYNCCNKDRYPSKSMIEKSQQGKKYFKEDQMEEKILLKDQEELMKEGTEVAPQNQGYFTFNKLEEMLAQRNPPQEQMESHELFMKILRKLLAFDPQERISAEQAFVDPFVEGQIVELSSIMKLQEIKEEKA